MNRSIAALATLILMASMAHAHFPWLVPEKGTATAQVLFSENLTPDKPELLKKLDKTEWYARDNAGKTTKIRWVEGKEGFSVAAPEQGPTLLGGVCAYGVVQRGKDEPFLLNYYTTALVGASPEKRPGEIVYEAWDVMPLQILPARGTARGFVVLFQGKPLAEAEVVALPPGKEDGDTLKTNAQGVVELPAEPQGRWALRVRHIEKQAGERDGKEYKEIRHYATRVVGMPSLRPLSKAEPAK